MKKCFKCGVEKELSCFYVHKQMADGHLGKCIECTKKDVAMHREENIEKIREYDRTRGKLPHRMKLATLTTKEYRKKHPHRYHANSLLSKAVADKRIEKPDKCSMCGNKTKISGHHNDYFKPLDVIWVCQPCHKKLHKTAKLSE